MFVIFELSHRNMSADRYFRFSLLRCRKYYVVMPGIFVAWQHVYSPPIMRVHTYCTFVLGSLVNSGIYKCCLFRGKHIYIYI